jgi:hypothetical protein
MPGACRAQAKGPQTRARGYRPYGLVVRKVSKSRPWSPSADTDPVAAQCLKAG